MHFAVQTRPLVQSGLLTQALVCTLHLSAKHCGSTSSEVDLLFARSASSFSAHAGLPLTSSDPASAATSEACSAAAQGLALLGACCSA